MLLTISNTYCLEDELEDRTDHFERHKAIIAYLSSNNLPNTASALRDELGLGDTFDATTSKKYEGLLEKKWTSVVRLQKKVRHNIILRRCLPL